jgi:hypothetical protein
VTVARRLTTLESSLTPTQRVVAWLDEAHRFDSLNAYVDSLLGQPAEAFPINRLAKEAVNATRAALRGKPPEVVDPVVRRTLRDTIFRFDLVMRINVIGQEMIDRELLLYLVFAGQLALFSSDDRRERRADSAHLDRMAQCRDLTTQRVVELLAAQEARSIAEQRYLGGHPTLFPEGLRLWEERLHQAQELAVIADRLAELDGVPPAEPWDPDAVSTRAAVIVTDLVEPARVTTLEKLDEGRQALTIATGWLRSKAPARVPTEQDRPSIETTL